MSRLRSPPFALGVVLACAALLPPACDDRPVSAERADAIADRLWSTRCVACHGEAGDGRGPGAGALPVVPPDMTRAAFQADVTDEHLRNIITGGGKAVSKSVVMPANVDLRDEPVILDALVRKVRSLGPMSEATTGSVSAASPHGTDGAPSERQDSP